MNLTFKPSRSVQILRLELREEQQWQQIIEVENLDAVDVIYNCNSCCTQALRLALREEQRQRKTLTDGLEAERAATAAAVRRVDELVSMTSLAH